MKKYLICNYGCDDEVQFEIKLTEEQAKFLIKIFEENNKRASYQCKPSLFICDKYTKKENGWYNIPNYLNKSYEELKENK